LRILGFDYCLGIHNEFPSPSATFWRTQPHVLLKTAALLQEPITTLWMPCNRTSALPGCALGPPPAGISAADAVS
jgi:hypothetical protein